MLIDRYPPEDVFARVPELAAQTDPVLQQLDRDAGPGHVLTRERERVGRDVDRGHPRPGMFVCDRQGDRTRPSADVEDTRSLDAANVRKSALDHDLGLGPWNQRPPVAGEREPSKAPFAEDVGDRLTRRPASDERAVLVQLVAVQGPFEVGVERDSLPAERVREQELRVEPCRL